MVLRRDSLLVRLLCRLPLFFIEAARVGTDTTTMVRVSLRPPPPHEP